MIRVLPGRAPAHAIAPPEGGAHRRSRRRVDVRPAHASEVACVLRERRARTRDKGCAPGRAHGEPDHPPAGVRVARAWPIPVVRPRPTARAAQRTPDARARGLPAPVSADPARIPSRARPAGDPGPVARLPRGRSGAGRSLPSGSGRCRCPRRHVFPAPARSGRPGQAAPVRPLRSGGSAPVRGRSGVAAPVRPVPRGARRRSGATVPGAGTVRTRRACPLSRTCR